MWGTKVKQHLWAGPVKQRPVFALAAVSVSMGQSGGQNVEPKGRFCFWTLVDVFETQTPLQSG